jgi:class 3 adenylate cyclase
VTYLDFFPVPLDPQTTVALSAAYGLLMIGVATAFFVAEPHSPITRAFSFAYGMTGVSSAAETAFVFLYPEGSAIPWFARFPLLTTITISAYPLWLLRLARTAQATRQAMLWITGCVWLQWALAAMFLVVGGVYAEERMHEFYMGLGRVAAPSELVVRLFIVPNLISTIALTVAGVILFTQRIDPAERRRALAFAVSFPFLAGIFSLPAGYNLLAGFTGTLIFLLGAIRFHVMLGERGQFMSRFLSTHVAELVRRRGLSYVMQPQALTLTVVSCNLRGFTRLSQQLSSEQVIRLLNEYYDVIGSAVADIGATIKDYAGDGVLILVGAPLPAPDHAQRGLALARVLEKRVQAVIARWAGSETPLGLGIGIASGKVAVGAIGSVLRMEYTAVGPAVNLASRLCEQARDREILVDARTVELAGTEGLVARGNMQVRGMRELLLYAVAQA